MEGEGREEGQLRKERESSALLEGTWEAKRGRESMRWVSEQRCSEALCKQ